MLVNREQPLTAVEIHICVVGTAVKYPSPLMAAISLVHSLPLDHPLYPISFIDREPPIIEISKSRRI